MDRHAAAGEKSRLSLKEFAIPFGLIYFGIWIWLFWARPTFLIIAFSFTFVLVVLFYRNEDVYQIIFERQRVRIDLQKIQEDIYAKIDELQKLAERMGELGAFTITQLWRLPPEDHSAAMIQERDRLAAVLNEMKIRESKIYEITSVIDRRVTEDLANHVF